MKEKIIEKRIYKLKGTAQFGAGGGFYIVNPINVRYLSGFTGGEAQLLITDRENFLITDFRYIEQAGLETEGAYKVLNGGRDPGKFLHKLAKENRIKNIFIEEDFITYKEYKNLRESLNGIMLLDGSGKVERLRSIKDETETALIYQAARIGDAALERVIRYIRPGMTELQVKNRLEYEMMELGASGTSFETIVASGKRSAMPHGTASEKVIDDGDIVTVDFGCIYKGYCSDMTRTFFVGNTEKRDETKALEKIYHIVNTAREKAIKAAKAGITGKDLDFVARSYIREMGYGENFGHGLGHGVGLMIHEAPNANTSNDRPLEANSIITIEPGIYIEGLGGVRIEDMIIIKDGGCEVITQTDRNLIVI